MMLEPNHFLLHFFACRKIMKVSIMTLNSANCVGTLIQKFKPKRVIIYLRKKEFGKRWNDIKAKKIGDVYNQMQRQMDQEKESLQNATRCTLDPFNITDIVTSSHHHQS
ncbi:hypothetical protein BC941DRAFT_229931 [Chlamydoabsidia padenii]|nr:hypothetical protein BC941DRAFT_229931 [Chlamydoabsidia padenii]